MKINYPVLEKTTIINYLNSFKLGKSNIYKIMLDSLYVNGSLVKKDCELNPGDTITIDFNEELGFEPTEGSLDILYEDEHFLIINKPAHIIIHDEKDSLCNIVANYYKENNINLSVKYASRLDTDTSGVIIFCKDLLTLCYMNALVLNHNLKRQYMAVCEGRFKQSKGIVEMPIGRDRHNNNRYIVYKNGKYAKTEYEVLDYKDNKSLVLLTLFTGRTHQIRVHMSYLHHPLIGDVKYGGKSAIRVMLHSYFEAFKNPYTNELMEVKCAVPKEFNLR